MAGTSFDERIMNELKDAMRAKDSLRSNTLRAMKSALKYKMVEKQADSLSDDESMSVFKSLLKQRLEAVDQYEKSNMQEAADKEKKEAEIIQSFLPQPLSAEESEKLVTDVIQETGASSIKDMGSVMKEVNKRAAGRADGRVISEIVKKKLAS